MGVSLYYRVDGPVSPDINQAVRAEAETVNAAQPWILCEPICFFDTEDGELCGGSKLNLMPHPDELAQLRDHQPERNDLQALLHALADWSTRSGIAWELEINGTPLGRIEPGDGPEGLSAVFERMAELAGLDPIDETDEHDPPTGPCLYRG